MTAPSRFDAETLAEASKHCGALARANARDQWLGALYAPPESRDALFALACFDHEIRQARLRSRDPNLAVMRLAWWREAALGGRDAEAAGSPVALALCAAVDAFQLPAEPIEAMLDARLTEIAPPDALTLAAFERYAADSEGARLRLASRIAAGGRDIDAAEAHEPAGLALALARMLADLPFQAGAGPMLFPVDVAERHGATLNDLDARNATPGVIAACGELRTLARARLEEAERRLRAFPPPILPAFVPLGSLRLDLDRLEGSGRRPFDPPAEASALRRQWAIWRWARRF
ncbi:phytoene/squalene synthase family protein [Roseiarcus sp.]|uniref:phytoene/squalene synthase family protein n=1 Tax=Roseiarcus sp. TaxID=1969460 RepID=UPI003F9C1ED1